MRGVLLQSKYEASTTRVFELEDVGLRASAPLQLARHVPNIEELSLRDNRLDDIADIVQSLTPLHRLRFCWLNGNPVRTSRCVDGADYFCIEYVFWRCRLFDEYATTDRSCWLRCRNWRSSTASSRRSTTGGLCSVST